MNAAQLRGVILDELRKVAPGMPVDEVDDEDNLREALDIDSFDALNWFIGLNASLGIDIPEKDYGKLNTIKETMDYISARM